MKNLRRAAIEVVKIKTTGMMGIDI